MRFFVDKNPINPEIHDIVLHHSSWDDWFDYSTLYSVEVYNDDLESIVIGAVKIGATDITKKSAGGNGIPNIPMKFNKLDGKFFSLGQDIDYYDKINQLGDEFRYKYMMAMNDIAFDRQIYSDCIELHVTRVSLLRTVPDKTIVNDYRKVSKGQSALTDYKFSYRSALTSEKNGTRFELNFNVKPYAYPPTNIHVIIGRNGVGKTHLIRNMIKSLTMEKARMSRVGRFNNDSEELLFANIVAVSFSAFDVLDISKEVKGEYGKIRYKYIGLKKMRGSKTVITKSKRSLTNEFWDKFNHCMLSGKKERWVDIINELNSDPIFENIDISVLAKYHGEKDCEDKCKVVFSKLSSGHAIVLLTLTGLVSTVEQKTLVLLDEPEAHLHPPLLSAFIRALSKLLLMKNGVAILATHSPVVLQEVPKSCVWRLDRSNNQAKAERLEIETFGANIGTLTREVFGYEVTNSGFHSLLQNVASRVDSYDEAVDYFSESLGDEAKGILRGMMYHKE